MHNNIYIHLIELLQACKFPSYFQTILHDNVYMHLIAFYLQATYVDLMVMQRSCSSLRVSVKRVSPAREEAMIPALDTRESVSVDFPWSTCAITDMLRMLDFLSMMARIWSTVKFTWKRRIWHSSSKLNLHL